jgi:hypothetical protein
MAGNDTSGDSGWAAFAGVLLFIVGALNALWGLAAILNEDVVIVGGEGALIADVMLWGWVHLVLGAVIAVTGVGLIGGTSSGARWAAVLFVAVNAVAQVVWFPAAPLWAFLLIVLDVTIIYQLTARWGAQAGWNN